MTSEHQRHVINGIVAGAIGYTVIVAFFAAANVATYETPGAAIQAFLQAPHPSGG